MTNQHDSNLAPRRPETEPEWAIEPVWGPEDLGFPANPTTAQVRCWTNQELFLAALARTGSIGAACAESGVGVPNAEFWASKDTYGFKRRKADALQAFLGKVEVEINRRAIEGVDHPVIYKGQITKDSEGEPVTRKEYSDNLLMFRAKRLDPEYRDNYTNPADKFIPTVTQINIIMPAGVNDGKNLVIEGAARVVPDEEDTEPNGAESKE